MRRLHSSRSTPGESVGVRVLMAAALAAALIEGGMSARAAETANPAWFTSTSSGSFANAASGDAVLSSIRSLSRFAQTDPAGVPVAFAGTSLFGGRDVEVAALLGRNLAVEFGARAGNASDFGSDGLFTNLAGSMQPFSQTGREMHAGSAIGFGDGLSLNFGESFGESDKLLPAFGPAWMETPLAGGSRGQAMAQTGFAALNWDVAPWANLGLVARQGSAQATPPLVQPANLSTAKASTQTLGVSGRVGLGAGWVTSFSYNEGITQLDLRPAANLAATENARGRAYGVAIAKHGLFGGDALGLAVSQQSLPSFGNVDLGDAPVADPFDGFISSTTRPILSNSKPETDLQLGYVTTFLDGALALQANAGYQMNSSGQPGNNGVAVLSRAKINF